MSKLFGMDMTRAELARHTGSGEQMFWVKLVELADGPERGVRVLQFASGSGLTFEVFVDRGMDIGTVGLHAIPLGFRSPAGFRNPALVNVEAEDGLGWLRGFTGIVNTCGLDHIMGPEEETAEH